MSKDEAKPDWAMNKREMAAAERVAQGLAPKKRRWWLWPLIVLVLAGGAGGYFYQTGQLQALIDAREAAREAAAAEEAARAARPPLLQLAPFEVATAAQMELRETLKATGSLAPARQLHLSAEVSGRVITVNGQPGDAVSEGDVLVQFEVDGLESQLAQALANAKATQAQLDLARTEYERTQDLVDRGLSASNALDRSRANLDQLTASLAAQTTMVENARRSLDRATVTAPFDGVISARSIDPGQFVGAGSPLMNVVDLTRLEVEATAPVSFAPQLAPGQRVELKVEGFGDRIFTGQVERLNPVAIEGSRMLPVYVSLENEGGELRGGMFASGRIVLETKSGGLGVPSGALHRDVDGQYVIVVTDGMTMRRAVEVVRTWDGGTIVEIASGLEPGEVVVAEPLPELKPGMQIELVE
jgi:RND family efflux transporter MFP subunit